MEELNRKSEKKEIIDNDTLNVLEELFFSAGDLLEALKQIYIFGYYSALEKQE